MRKPPDNPDTHAPTALDCVHIDKDLPADQRMADFLAQIKNPYCYLDNGTRVQLRFNPEGKDLARALGDYFIRTKQ